MAYQMSQETMNYLSGVIKQREFDKARRKAMPLSEKFARSVNWLTGTILALSSVLWLTLAVTKGISLEGWFFTFFYVMAIVFIGETLKSIIRLQVGRLLVYLLGDALLITLAYGTLYATVN